MRWKPSSRLDHLGSAIFTEMNKLKKKVEVSGTRVIDLGIGSPDQPPAPHVIEALVNSARNPKHYGYPMSDGTPAFRQTVADWYRFRFGVELDPDTEVLSLMGSQDGLAHLAQAWVNPGDVVLVPDPGYPIYAASIHLAGGRLHPMPLCKENGFLPVLEDIPNAIREKAKMMILNYPNNPLAATADCSFFEDVVRFAQKHDIMVVHDLAYSELAFDGYRPSSFLEVDGAREIGVEFNSLSKSFNMAGCRIGYVVGNAEIIKPLAVIKSNIDYGVFLPVQDAACAAMKADMDGLENRNHLIYQERRDRLVEGLRQAGWPVENPKATMFIWAEVPDGRSSEEFAFDLLEQAGVVVIPGNAFGTEGEGYVRIALVEPVDVLDEVVERLKGFLGG